MLFQIIYYNNNTEIISTKSYSNFQVNEVPNFLTTEECNFIKNYILQDDINTYKYYDNMHWKTLPNNEQYIPQFYKIYSKLRQYFSTIINKSFYLENLEIAKYTPNNTCHYHYDACNGSVNYCNKYDKPHGPRQISIIMYLNDSFSGGGTKFSKINKIIKAEKGKLVWFENYNNNNIIDETEHCGDVVENDNKFICITWIRFKNKN
jgi:hypothetical protein